MPLAPAAPRSTDGPFSGDGVTLFRRSVVPAGPAAFRLGILPGYGDHSGRYGHFMRWMAERNVACHGFDFRGHGRSTGLRGHVHAWDDYLADLKAFFALDELVADKGPPLFLLAHSHGALVLAAAAIRGSLPPPAGVVLTAPYFRNRVPVSPLKRLLGRLAGRLVPWFPVNSGIRPEWLTSDPEMRRDRERDPYAFRTATPRWFTTMLAAQDEVMSRAESFREPVLVLVPDADPVADPAAMAEFYDRAGSARKTIRHYPGMVHELLRETGREKVFADVLAWMRS